MHEHQPPPSASHFDVLVLGPLTVYRDGLPVDAGAWQSKVRSLLRILAVAPGKRRLRDELVDILWPEADPEAGPRNLRVVAHMLRKGLGGGEPTPILSEHGWMALNPAHEWDLDLDRFEHGIAVATQIAELEEVAGLYRGEPLPEERYEDWALPVRVRVFRMWRDLCLHLARLHREAGRHEAAVRWLEPVLEADRTDEEAMRALLQELGALGRRSEALRLYTAFAQRLHDELELEPAPETRAVVLELRQKAGATRDIPIREPKDVTSYRALPVIPAYPLPVPYQLVGRHDALGQILRFLPSMHGSVRFGEEPGLVLIQGEPGIGKTRLLAEVAARARAAGMLTLAGAAYEEEGTVPYGPVHDAFLDYVDAQPPDLVRLQLGSILPDLAWILPELQRDLAVERQFEGEGLRLRLFLAIAEALERMAQDRPLVLLLDDLHFADSATLELMHFLARQGRPRRALLVGAASLSYGGSPPSAGMRMLDLESAGRAALLEIRGLTHDDLSLLLEEALNGKVADLLVTALRIRSRGNPGMALALLNQARDRGALELGTQGWQLREGCFVPIPPELTGSVLRILDCLGPNACEVLEIGATLGRGFSSEPAQSMWDGDPRPFGAALQAAVDAGLLEERDDRYVFTHPLIRETVESRLTRARAASLHAAAGEALARLRPGAAGEAAAWIAEHFAAAGPPYADRAARYWAAAETGGSAQAPVQEVRLQARGAEGS